MSNCYLIVDPASIQNQGVIQSRTLNARVIRGGPAQPDSWTITIETEPDLTIRVPPQLKSIKKMITATSNSNDAEAALAEGKIVVGPIPIITNTAATFLMLHGVKSPKKAAKKAIGNARKHLAKKPGKGTAKSPVSKAKKA